MTLQSVATAKTWLRSKYINVPDDWLQACIEWINEENRGISQAQAQINDLVYEQWLLSDLHELKSKCLPQEVHTSSRFQLTGTYALQIDSVVDVSKSYYSQLQKVKGTTNDNVNVTADPPAPWEPKATRMLMLKLTDGSTDVQGMEYQKIACLHERINPGAKILVQGSVLCRQGILMLTGKNVKFLNGEVDTLMEMNTDTNVLQKALETSMQNSGKRYKQEFDGTLVQNKKPLGSNIKSKPASVKREPVSQTNQYNAGHINQRTKTLSTDNAISHNDIEWEDDIAIDELLDDMDDFEMGQVPPPPPSVNIKGQKLQNKNNSKLTSKNSQTHAVYGSRNSNLLPSNDNFDNKGKTVGSKCDKSGLITNIAAVSNSFINRGKSNYTTDTKMRVIGHSSPQSNLSSATNRRGSSIPNIDDEEILFDDDFGNELDDLEIKSVLNSDTNVQKESRSTEICLGTDVVKMKSTTERDIKSIKSVPDIKIKTESEFRNTATKEPGETYSLNTCKPLFAPQNKTLDKYVKSAKLSCDKEMPRTGIKRTATDAGFHGDAKRILSNNPGIDISAEPFTYLSIVKNRLPTEEAITFKVKAYISTLTGRLEYNGGKMWSLSCKINDGTSSQDVDLSNAVLTQLIGFSAQDSVEMRKRAKLDTSIRDILVEGVQQCQQKLVELLCVMKIQVMPGCTKPEIISLSDLTNNDIENLELRVSRTMENSV